VAKERYKILESVECFGIYKLILYSKGITYDEVSVKTGKSISVISQQLTPLRNEALVKNITGTGVRGIPARVIASQIGAQTFLKKHGFKVTNVYKFYQTNENILERARTFGEFFSLLKTDKDAIPKILTFDDMKFNKIENAVQEEIDNFKEGY